MSTFLKILPFIFLAQMPSCAPNKSGNVTITFEEISEQEVNHDYVEISQFRIAWNETFDQELDEYFVYYFSMTCSHCQKLKNFIIEKALERGDIFFVEASADDVIKNSVISTFNSSSAEFLAILGYPSLVKISHKILVENVAGDDAILGLLK